MSERSSAAGALAAELQPLRGEAALVDELLERVDEADGELADWLETFGGPEPERREALADVVSMIVRDLAPEDAPPASGPEAALWQELVILIDRLYGSGVVPLGRLPFISDKLLELLAAEAASAGRRVDRAGEAGRFLASLAVSRKLNAAVADAVGFAVVPTYRAVFLYDIPGSHVKTHVDTREYEVVFHLILDHVMPDGGAGSALVVHRPGHGEPERVRLRPGEGVALRGRGTIHSWEPMGADERRTLVAVGFHRADGR